MRSCRLLALSLAFALAFALAPATGCGDRPTTAEPPAPAAVAAETADAPAGPVAEPHTDGARSDYIGVVFARSRSDVAPRVGGRLVDVHVRTGDRVEQGALIATIESDELREELDVARALARSAQASTRQAAVAYDEARAELRLLRRTADTVARVAIDRAEFAADKAKAARARARAEAETQERRIDQLETRLGQAELVAPFSGVVAMRYLDPGATVAPNQPVVRLVDSDAPWVRFAMPSDRAGALGHGDQVTVEVEAVREPITATVRQVAPEIDPISQMILVEAELDPAAAKRGVRSGLAAWVRPPEP